MYEKNPTKYTFLTSKEIKAFQKRPCAQCENLKLDDKALFGYCVRFQVWNPTGKKCKLEND